MACIDEANFVRLLNCTEDLSCSGNIYGTDFPVYVEKLQELLESFNSKKVRPAAEYLHIYKTRVEQQALIAARLKLADSDAASPFKEALRKWLPNTEGIRNRRLQCTFFYPVVSYANVRWIEKGLDGDCDFPVVGDERNETLLPQTTPRFISDAPIDRTHCQPTLMDTRRQLLGEGTNGDSKPTENDALLDSELLERDRIASGMLSLTEELRQTQLALGERIRSDVNVLEASSVVAQSNAESLAAVSCRVREELGHKFGTVVWLLFLFSIIVFFWMVLFIKFTPKGIRTGS